MSTGILWDNVVAYSLQVGLLVGLAAFLPAVLGIKIPRVRLFYWHTLLAACLLLPPRFAAATCRCCRRLQVTSTSVTTISGRGTRRDSVFLSPKRPCCSSLPAPSLDSMVGVDSGAGGGIV